MVDSDEFISEDDPTSVNWVYLAAGIVGSLFLTFIYGFVDIFLAVAFHVTGWIESLGEYPAGLILDLVDIYQVSISEAFDSAEPWILSLGPMALPVAVVVVFVVSYVALEVFSNV